MLNVRVHSMGYLEKLRSIFDQCTKFYLSMNAKIKFEISKGLRIGNNSQCPRTDLSKRFLPKPMTTTG